MIPGEQRGQRVRRAGGGGAEGKQRRQGFLGRSSTPGTWPFPDLCPGARPSGPSLGCLKQSGLLHQPGGGKRALRGKSRPAAPYDGVARGAGFPREYGPITYRGHAPPRTPLRPCRPLVYFFSGRRRSPACRCLAVTFRPPAWKLSRKADTLLPGVPFGRLAGAAVGGGGVPAIPRSTPGAPLIPLPPGAPRPLRGAGTGLMSYPRYRETIVSPRA